MLNTESAATKNIYYIGIYSYYNRAVYTFYTLSMLSDDYASIHGCVIAPVYLYIFVTSTTHRLYEC